MANGLRHDAYSRTLEHGGAWAILWSRPCCRGERATDARARRFRSHSVARARTRTHARGDGSPCRSERAARTVHRAHAPPRRWPHSRSRRAVAGTQGQPISMLVGWLWVALMVTVATTSFRDQRLGVGQWSLIDCFRLHTISAAAGVHAPASSRSARPPQGHGRTGFTARLRHRGALQFRRAASWTRVLSSAIERASAIVPCNSEIDAVWSGPPQEALLPSSGSRSGLDDG